MVKVVTRKQIDEIVRLKDEERLSFQDIGKQLNLGADTVSRFYIEEVRKKVKEAEKVEKEDIAASERRDKPYKTLATNKTVAFDPSALAVIEQFKKKNIFNDMDEAVNKSLEMMAAQTNNPKYVDFLTKGGKIQMQEQEPNPEKEIKKVQAQEIADVYLAKKKAEVEALSKKIEEGKSTPNSIMPLLQEQLAMKQMKSIITEMNKDDKETSNSNPLKEMKEMMMMQVYGNMMQPHKGNGEALQFQRKIDELQKQIQNQGIISEIKKISENSKGQSMNTDDYLKLFADKQVAVEKQKIEMEKVKQEAQKERDKRIEDQNLHHQENTTRQIQELQVKLSEAKKEGGGIEEITKLTDKIKKVREVAKELGGGTKEKTTGEIASELVLGVAEKLKEPISNATKGFADKMATERVRAQGPVYSTRPTPAPTPSNPGPATEVPEPTSSTEVPEPTPSPKAPEPTPEPTSPVEPSQDLVNTFSTQNTSKNSKGTSTES